MKNTGLNHKSFDPFFVALSKHIREAVIILDNQCNILLFNRCAEKLFSISQKDALQKSFKQICLDKNVEYFIQPYLSVIAQKTSITIPPDKNELSLLWDFDLIEHNNNNFYLLVTTGIHENASQNEILKLETLVENMPYNVYWMDKNCLMMGCNQNVLNMLSLTKEEFKGKTYDELAILGHWPPGLANTLKKDDMDVLKTGVPIITKEDPPLPNGKGGEFNFLTSRVPIRNRHGEIIGVAGISTDVSALKAAKQKAEAANHAKTEFIANMSHDIRTPLAGVIGLANILEGQVTDPIQKKEAHDLGQSGNELLNMLNEVLDVIAADHVNTNDIHEGPFRLSELVQGIVNLEQPSVTVKNIELMIKLDPTIPVVLISDYKKIHHILLNLVGNAIKFTTTGHVEVSVTLLEKQIDTAMLQFKVIDTGKGIPDEALAHVFDPFFRVTPSYKGLDKGHGLGLHIAQTYVQLLGGNIEVISKLNEGSVFTFTLPIKIGDQNSSPVGVSTGIIVAPSVESINSTTSVPAAQDEALPTAPKVLIIEDNPIALTVAETLIKNSHLATGTAIDGESGLALAKTGSYDMIVSDVGLPGMSGIEFARQLRAYEKEQDKPPTPIIGLTAHVEGEARDECLAAGMNDVLIKPLTVETIQKMMAQFSLCHKASEPDRTALGPDLPHTETELFELSHLSLLDAEIAIKELGNNKALLIKMLQSFLEHLPQERQEIQAAYDAQNWDRVEKLAHKMKGGAVYLKLNKLSIACQYLERYHKANHSKLLEQLYQQMMTVMEDTTPVVVQWLERNQ